MTTLTGAYLDEWASVLMNQIGSIFPGEGDPEQSIGTMLVDVLIHAVEDGLVMEVQGMPEEI